MANKSYQFTEELKARLEEYNELDTQLKTLEEKKEAIREQIEKWMELHEEKHFEIQDHHEQIWKMTIATTHRHRVKDYEMLKAVLPDQHKHLVVESDSDTFTIRKIDKFSKEWQLKAVS